MIRNLILAGATALFALSSATPLLADAMSDAIMGMIKDDGGMHEVKTLGGCILDARMDGDNITLTDENGNVATVTIADVKQSNGVIHVIDTVLLPKMG